MNYVGKVLGGSQWELIAILTLLQIGTSIDIFGIEKCTFGLKYMFQKHFSMTAWNTNSDRYSNVVLNKRKRSHILWFLLLLDKANTYSRSV